MWITPFVSLCLETGSRGKESVIAAEAREDKIKLVVLWQGGEVIGFIWWWW